MMRGSKRLLLVWVGALLACCALGQQPLPNLKVDVDGKPAELGLVHLELNTYLVPLRLAVGVLTKGEGSLNVAPGTEYQVLLGGKVRVKIPTSARQGPRARVIGSHGLATKEFEIETYPFEITPKGGQPTMYIDLDLLASTLGVAVDVNSTQLSLLTPDYWCSQIGIDPARAGKRIEANLENLPEIGVSPPARTILGWVRTGRAGFTQAYRLDDRSPAPIFGVNALGDEVDVITPGDTPQERGASPEKPARFETYNYGSSVGKTVSFVAIVTSRSLGAQDPVKAINSGALKEDEWSIVGIRQRVIDLPVLFENRTVAEGEDLTAFAERNKNSPSIVRVLNGIPSGAKVSPGTKLTVMVGMSPEVIAANQASKYVFKGLYEVQQGDTVSSIASSWEVEISDIYATNPGLAPGGEPLPGDLLNVIVSKEGRVTKAPAVDPSGQEITNFTGTAVTLDKVDVKETSKPNSQTIGQIPKARFIEILGKVSAGDVYRVQFENLMGFVPGSQLRIRETSVAPEPDANDDIVAREALKYLGTPYVWGGNSLTSGIDCSHYVAQVYTRIGWKAPPPPVLVQETIGDIVHFKPGQARRAGKTIVLPNPAQFPRASANVRALKPGDRIIFQRGNTDASGSRHTGIYIGKVPASWQKKYGPLPYAFAHASSSRGVTIGTLTSRYYWGVYRFTVRGQAK